MNFLFLQHKPSKELTSDKVKMINLVTENSKKEIKMQTEIIQMEKTAEGFKNETTRQLTQNVIACLKNLEACM